MVAGIHWECYNGTKENSIDCAVAATCATFNLTQLGQTALRANFGPAVNVICYGTPLAYLSSYYALGNWATTCKLQGRL